jgi:hypothetical protein
VKLGSLAKSFRMWNQETGTTDSGMIGLRGYTPWPAYWTLSPGALPCSSAGALFSISRSGVGLSGTPFCATPDRDCA